MTTADDTLAQLVTEDTSRAPILDRLGLDYCCGGDETLAHACARLGLDPTDVVAQLDTGGGAGDAHAYGASSTPELIAHLVDGHHAYLHAELPELDRLSAKVLDVHGARHPELAEVRELVEALRADLEPHLLKEERVLFPAIEQMLAGPAQFPFGSIRNPIRMMGVEHDRAGEVLARLRSVTGGYAPPADACASYRSLYERLAELEHDTHVHVFEENHLLFPRVVALEASQH
jgi:regulator of cell morphogenesis and NO signaling